jgi:uncharacterized repeat protein (TIGR03803 family)
MGTGFGTIFSLTPSGVVKQLYSFCGHGRCDEWGGAPVAGLVQAVNGNSYGTTPGGGDKEHGTVFEITLAGTMATRVDFNGTDGIRPEAGLIQATDANFYGTTAGGGKHGCEWWWSYGCGTVFKMTAGGGFVTLYKFCSQAACIDGANPYSGLVQGTDGNFYGTTRYGGSNEACNGGGCGTVFKITSTGTLTTLYSFCSQANCTDGSAPLAGLVQATDGNFYGTTSTGGVNGEYGTIFKITPTGTLTTLHSFCSQSACADGEAPLAGLMQATDGNFYGTTSQGGASDNCANDNGCGTVFQITPSGALTTLYSFCSQSGCLDGQTPYAGLVQDTNGDLYGTTAAGGANGYYGLGTLFMRVPGQGDHDSGVSPITVPN